MLNHRIIPFIRNTFSDIVIFRFLFATLNIIACVMVLSSCQDSSSEKTESVELQSLSNLQSDNNLIIPEQNWSSSIADESHHLTFGSRLVPYAWIAALESSNSEKLFFAEENLLKLGFIGDKQSPSNPDGLAIGFTRDVDSHDQPWVGLGCAACHTGQVTYQNRAIRLEGGQGLINFSRFEQTLTDALTQTLKDSAKFERFKQQLIKQNALVSTLEIQLAERVSYLTERARMNATDVAYGFGRLDAFGQIFNTVAVELLEQPNNRRSPNAPVSFPVLWSAPHLDLVQWNGSAPNSEPGPLIQNVTTAIAVYGQAKVINSDSGLGYSSSVNIPNLTKIENWLYRLKSPQWPAEILGQLDPQLINRGQRIYQQECQSCHTLAERNQSKQKFKVQLTPLSEVGTDPLMAKNFIESQADSGVMQGKKLLFLTGKVIEKQSPTIDLVAHVAVGAALHHPLSTIAANIEDYHNVFKAAVNNNPDYYKARSLDGIWSSAPYLHNGSVLTLQELLSPPTMRRAKFYLGNRELDTERVGLVSVETTTSSEFDTSLAGNSNAGHLYGTQLADAERRALLEYLKSL